ncbi:25S rRNA (adenine645-N1)-methyltransferase [Coemansia spiralis]|uniref:Ribosomal RNA-processing protein 8 n=1 Tax=Coemansia spiralis TaxID=417178 RepID=A0A9W8G7I2_9FUNG|nr:25S rRNA (adenine645-N1)-methyltransferase [Coemansia spiralis]
MKRLRENNIPEKNKECTNAPLAIGSAQPAKNLLQKVKKDQKRVSQALKLKKIKQQTKKLDLAGDDTAKSSNNRYGLDAICKDARHMKPKEKQIQKETYGLSALQQQMQKKLKGARFRWINETLYTTTGDKAFEMVQEDPSIFKEYHEGFNAQVEKWPVNPVDVLIKQLEHEKKQLVVADLGCGEARIAATIGSQHKVHSFDLVAHNKHVTACNIADVPLKDSTVDVAIFCLALMGTDFIKFIREANRILRVGGELRIAEVISRISDMKAFANALEEQGFNLIHKDVHNKMFAMLHFTKVKSSPQKFAVATTDLDLLKPCIYKRR